MGLVPIWRMLLDSIRHVPLDKHLHVLISSFPYHVCMDGAYDMWEYGFGSSVAEITLSKTIEYNVVLRRIEEIGMKHFYDAWRRFALRSMHRAIGHYWKAREQALCLMVHLAYESEVRHGKSRPYAFIVLPFKSQDSMVTYTEVSSPFEDLSDIRSPGVNGLPMMLEDPYVEAALQAPPSPNYVPGPEYPPLPVYVPYVPEPVYLEFMPPKDDVLPAEEQPLPVAVSPTADSPCYITEFDLEEDPKEDD
ncbi:hypothetical protein Tco_0313105 [Tanacetum coccineum]